MTLLQKILNSKAGAAALILRVPVGLILAAHGAQKLFAWFGGYGLEGTGQWMASIGLEPGYWLALMAGSAEFFGGDDSWSPSTHKEYLLEQTQYNYSLTFSAK